MLKAIGHSFFSSMILLLNLYTKMMDAESDLILLDAIIERTVLINYYIKVFFICAYKIPFMILL